MTREAPTKLSIEKDFRLWPFYEMFMNHIKNTGWLTSIVFTKSGTDYNIPKDFRQVKLNTIKTEYQAIVIYTSPNDDIKRIKYRSIYTWLLNSSDESAQDFFAKEINNHHQPGPMAWKKITTNILCGVKQVICCAQFPLT